MSDFARARQNMVDGQIRPSSVTDWRIIDAMRVVPRELFVPEQQRPMAYLDLDLEVGGSGPTRRFLLNPTMTARLLQAADIGANDNVLIEGCATGYVAALAARFAERVTVTLGDDAQAAQAQATLAHLGFANVKVRAAEAGAGSPADAPFDVIILNGATEIEPTALYEQLKLGGRLVGAFAAGKPQRVTVVTRSHCDFGSRVLFDASVPVLPGMQRTPAFVF
jgi:protein-L-isoaspartate(D-aspartate) O-methyltransferase